MNSQRLLFAAASAARYRAVIEALGAVFAITQADNRWDADAAIQDDPDVLVVEDVLPGGRGLKICERGRIRPDGSRRLVIVVGDRDRASIEEARARGMIDGWIPKDASAGEFLSRFWESHSARDDARAAALGAPAKALIGQARALFQELESGVVSLRVRNLLSQTATEVVSFADACTVSGFLGVMQEHHAYTFAHSLRVGILMATFGRHLGLDDDHVKLMAETGLAHDVGKLRIPLDILAKPGRLTEAEMDVMRTHPTCGAAMLGELYPDHPELIAAVRHHHEQLAGTGYPDGLRGGQIDELSLLTAVVDVYSALTDRRDYKQPMSAVQATEVMDGMAGPHLEPRLYRRFREVVGDLAATDGGAIQAA